MLAAWYFFRLGCFLVLHLSTQGVIAVRQARAIAALLSHWSVPQWALPLLYIKGAQIQTEVRWFFERLVGHLLGLLSILIKSIIPVPTAHLLIYWPVLWRTEQVWAQ